MTQPKILLTAILKDDSELEMAERMLGSFMPHCAGLAVALTGVSGKFDKLKKLITSHGGQYVACSPKTHPKLYGERDGGHFFAHFAEARNVSFELAASMQDRGKYDWWMWADVDDVLIEGQELAQAAQIGLDQKLDSVFFTYWYAVKQDESGAIVDVLIEHLRERLLKPGIFKWVSRLHEVAVALEDSYKPKHSLCDLNPEEGRHLVWAHLPGEGRVEAAMKRNIAILELQAKEEEHKDPRTIFYLAKTYYDLGGAQNLQLCQMLIEEYLELSGWAEERANALEYLANIASQQGNHRAAIQHLLTSLGQFPNRHMTFLLLAREHALAQLWDESDFWLDLSLKMEPPKARTTIGNPHEIKVMAASLCYNRALRKQQLDEAISYLKVRQTLLGTPDDGMLATLQDARQLNEAAKWTFNYAKWLKDTGHLDRIPALLESLPIELGREAYAHHIANEVQEPRVWGKDEICYYASFGAEHFEPWSPESLTTGIGGSETAVIQLAKRWAKAGWKVTVFGDPRERAGVHDGVTYRPWYEINWKDQFNVLIYWRSPHLLDREVKARKTFMDLHDIASQLDWTDERMKRVDKVFFKSAWHRTHIPKLPDDKCEIMFNGI